jgi:hypothetical protein
MAPILYFEDFGNNVCLHTHELAVYATLPNLLHIYKNTN